MIDLSQYPARTLRATVPRSRELLERCEARACRLPASVRDEEASPVPRLAIEGANLCTFHAQLLPSILHRVAGLVPDLEDRLTRSGSSGGDRSGGGRTSGVRDLSTLWNPAIAHVLAELRSWTRWVARTVMLERPLPERTDALAMLDELRELAQRWRLDRTSMSRADVDRLALLGKHRSTLDYQASLSWGLDERAPLQRTLEALARDHAHWLARYPTLGIAIYTDAVAHQNAARRALDARPLRRRILHGHFCQEITGSSAYGDVACGGQLVVVITDEDDERPSSILCQENPAHPQMQRKDWLNLVYLEEVGEVPGG